MLAQARQQAGLTVAEVSARTYVRESLIRAIEQDEFSGCGGDVYARGHIRAIAAAVGADPGALIGQYDAIHGYGPATLDDMLGPPRTAPGHGRRRGGWLLPVMMLCCIVGVIFVAYRMTGPSSSQPAAATSSRPAATRTAPPSHRPRPSTAPAPDTPPPVPAAIPVTELTPVSASAFGPGGTSDGDNPQNASLALSGDPATPWYTDWYTTAEFGNLKAGTGLLVDLGRSVTATGVTIRLGGMRGANLQVRAGTSTADLRVVARAADAGGAVRLHLKSHPQVRYVLIWFTMLPPDAAGTYQADVSGVTVTAFSQ